MITEVTVVNKNARDAFVTQVCNDFPQYNQYKISIKALVEYIDKLESRLEKAKTL